MAKEHIAYPDSVDRLIAEFSNLPGIGRRSAERLAFHILKSSPEDAMRLANVIAEVKTKVDRVKRTRIVSAVPQLVGRLAGASPCGLTA